MYFVSKKINSEVVCGFYTEVEEHTSKGRMDMNIKTDSYIYIFEFKFNASAKIVHSSRLRIWDMQISLRKTTGK